MAERVGRKTPNLEVAVLNPIRSKVLLIGGLFLFFRISLITLLFCRIPLLSEAQLRLCVENCCSIFVDFTKATRSFAPLAKGHQPSMTSQLIENEKKIKKENFQTSQFIERKLNRQKLGELPLSLQQTCQKK